MNLPLTKNPRCTALDKPAIFIEEAQSTSTEGPEPACHGVYLAGTIIFGGVPAGSLKEHDLPQ